MERSFHQVSSIFKAAFSGILFLIATITVGQTEKYTERLQGSTLTENQTVVIIDDKYQIMNDDSDWLLHFTNTKVYNRAILAIDQTSSVFQPADYDVAVELEVSYERWNGSSFVSETVTPNPVLSIEYRTNAAYKDKSVFQIQGGNKLTVKVLSITPDPLNAVMNLTLDAEIEVEREYKLDRSIQPIVSKNVLTNRGELEVTWDYIPGAKEYELEWTYVSFYGPNGEERAPEFLSVSERLFEFNSTRISTSNTYFKVPLLYEPGYILYRVRGVGREKDAAGNYKMVTGAWSIAPTASMTVNSFLPSNALRFTGHEKNINWQFTINYAEEGKNKVAVNYFDGSLRNRQTVSKLNTEDETIAGETVYDHQGRQAIQVLPAPTGNSKIQYNPNLNVDQDQNPYDRSKFDFNADCVSPPAIMDSTSGASQYYSSNNPDKSGHNAYIPTAEGYPFTQTEYTPDNTGRIKAQSGVGGNHYIGSGHESRYHYGKPFQEELDRLFATEVGNALHYKKNMVIDANGQISVTYMDAQGRVIASALAGTSPENLESLPATTDTLIADLLGKVYRTDKVGRFENTNLTEGKRSVDHSKPISTNGRAIFNYEYAPEKYKEICDQDGQITEYCYDCVVEVEIMLTNDCGESFLTGLNTANPTATATIIGEDVLASIRDSSYSSSAACNTQTSTFTKLNWETFKELEPGTYTISKVLRVNNEALDYYVYDYVTNNDCLVPLDSFVVNEIAKVDTIGCALPCDVCFARLGDYDQYDANVNADCAPCLTEMEYFEKLAECRAICDSGSVNCEAAYGNMLMDVGPYGQYGGAYTSDGRFAPHEFPLSVFNDSPSNSLPRKIKDYSEGRIKPDWRHPVNVDQDGNITGFLYLDRLGREALVQINLDESGVYFPEPLPGVIPQTINDTAYIKPQELKNAIDFFNAWNDSWATSLVYYHPEFLLYPYCLDHQASHDFDDEWMNSSRIEDKNPTTFMDPLGNNPYEALDPYFLDNQTINRHFDPLEYSLMKNDLSNYLTVNEKSYSIWKAAWATVHCPNFNEDPAVGSCKDTSCFANLTPSEFYDDKEVTKIFKSYYQSLKQKYQEQKAARFAIDSTYYNGCFDDPEFRITKDNFYAYHTRRANYPFWGGFQMWRSQPFNREQPCSVYSYHLYAEKRARFPRLNQFMPNSALDASLCYDEVSQGKYEVVNCPEKNNLIRQEQENTADFAYIQNCGECPVSKDVETFIAAVAKSGKLDIPSEQVSCYPTGSFAEFVPDLEKAMNLSGQGEIFWVTRSASPTHLIVDIIRQPNLDTCTLELKMKPEYTVRNYTIGSDMVLSNLSWDNIEGFCCFSTAGTFELFPADPFHNFSVNGLVMVDEGFGVKREVKIKIEGTSCVDLKSCPIPVICDENALASETSNLINTLTLKLPEYTSEDGVSYTGFGPYFLSPGGFAIDPSTDPFSGIMGTATQQAFVGAQTYKWTTPPSDNDTLFSANYEGIGSGGNITNSHIFQLWYSPGDVPIGFYWDDIVSFNNLRLDRQSYDLMYDVQDNRIPGSYFTINGLVEYVVGTQVKKMYVKFKGYTTLPLGECRTPSSTPVNQTISSFLR